MYSASSLGTVCMCGCVCVGGGICNYVSILGSRAEVIQRKENEFTTNQFHFLARSLSV